MSFNDIAICSRALVRIGAHPIASFNEGSAAAEIAGMLYACVRDALLAAYGWGFAVKDAALTRLADPPSAEFDYGFQLPNDFLRALKISTAANGGGLGGGFGDGGAASPYQIRGQNLLCSAEQVRLTYIYQVEEETFPPHFVRALTLALSAEFCLPITENSARAEILSKQADQEFARARQIDAQQDTPNRITRFSLIDARG